MYEIIETIEFKMIGDKEYPDMVDYSFSFNLNEIDYTVEVIEDMGTGRLWVRMNNTFLCPFRFNTNLLPSSLSYRYALVYDRYKQMFIFCKTTYY